MFSAWIRVLVLFLFLTSAMGTKKKNDWVHRGDATTDRLNELLVGPYKTVVDDIVKGSSLKELIKDPCQVASMVFLEAEKGGKEERTAVAILESLSQTKIRVEALRAQEPREHAEIQTDYESLYQEGDQKEDYYFFIILNYINLDEAVPVTDRLRLAKAKHQFYFAHNSLVTAKAEAEVHVDTIRVKMNPPLSRQTKLIKQMPNVIGQFEIPTPF